MNARNSAQVDREHQLRSCLARLQFELELSIEDAVPPSTSSLEAVREALALINNDLTTAATPSASATGSTTTRPLYIFDDDLRLAEALSRRLRSLGYRPILGGSSIIPAGLQARVLVDLGCLQQMTPKQRDVLLSSRPVVYTGATDAERELVALGWAAVPYLQKPASINQIRSLLEAQWQ